MPDAAPVAMAHSKILGLARHDPVHVTVQNQAEEVRDHLFVPVRLTVFLFAHVCAPVVRPGGCRR